MPTISIITPVVISKHDYVLETYRSLCEQDMPDGWSWQWVVQEDGTTGVPLAGLPADPRISVGSGQRGRACTARTLALQRAEGVLVRALDADDLLTPGALMRDITTLVKRPEIVWTVAPAVDLLPDGSLRPGPRDPHPGPLPPGFIADMERARLIPLPGTTLCTYTQLVRIMGGWPALPSDEDVGLMLAVEAVSAGWAHAKPGLFWRKWRGSSTADLAHRDPVEQAARVRSMLDRVHALRASDWHWSPDADQRRQLEVLTER